MIIWAQIARFRSQLYLMSHISQNSDRSFKIHTKPTRLSSSVLYKSLSEIYNASVLGIFFVVDSNFKPNIGRGTWIRVKHFDVSCQISEKFWFGQAISQKMSIFQEKISELPFFTQKISFIQTKLANCSYFWANYSIYLQNSPLSNLLPVHDKI